MRNAKWSVQSEDGRQSTFAGRVCFGGQVGGGTETQRAGGRYSPRRGSVRPTLRPVQRLFLEPDLLNPSLPGVLLGNAEVQLPDPRSQSEGRLQYLHASQDLLAFLALHVGFPEGVGGPLVLFVDAGRQSAFDREVQATGVDDGEEFYPCVDPKHCFYD